MAIARNLTQRENRTPAPGPFPDLRPRTPPRELRPRSALLLRSNVLFSLTLAINPSNKRDNADKTCKISPRDTRIVRKVRMKVGEFRFRIWMFALFVLFSFSFFFGAKIESGRSETVWNGRWEDVRNEHPGFGSWVIY